MLIELTREQVEMLADLCQDESECTRDVLFHDRDNMELDEIEKNEQYAAGVDATEAALRAALNA